MGSIAQPMFALMIGLVAAGLAAGRARADDADARPAAVKNGPLWERPRFTQFSATQCSSGSAPIDQIQLNREEVSDTKGSATYTDASRATGDGKVAGGWALVGDILTVTGAGFALVGDILTVTGAGFALEGRWSGAVLTATITPSGGGEPVRCGYEVEALRSFTQYQ